MKPKHPKRQNYSLSKNEFANLILIIFLLTKINVNLIQLIAEFIFFYRGLYFFHANSF